MDSDHSVIWRTIFLSVVFSALTLVVALSVFFYIRSREPTWDNRSGVSRLVVTNRNSPQTLGTEVFTMFGSEEITLTGESINDETTMYIANGGIILLEITGASRGEPSNTISSYSSKVLVSRKDTNSVSPMDTTGASLTATEIELSPVTGTDGTILIELVGSRIEVRGSSTENRKFILKIQATGWYP